MPAGRLTIEREREIQPDVQALLEASDAYFAALYPAESNHLVDVSELERPEVAFFVARIDGQAVGCGGYLAKGGYGEVKRLYVDEAGRGHKTGRRIMEHVIDHAKAAGLPSLKLELGIHQPEAKALYEKLGFTLTAPFGDYAEDPYSLFMEKQL